MNRARILTTLGLATLLLSLAACADEKGLPPSADDDDPIGLPVDQVFSHEGLEDEVDVLIDETGIPHIFARNDHDAFFVQGYLAAVDRFAQMDMARRLATGRLSELLGQLPAIGPILAELLTADTDLYFRTVFTGRDGRPLTERMVMRLSARSREILAAHADGVNAWIYDVITGRHGQTLPTAYQGLIEVNPAVIPPWTMDDTLAVGLIALWNGSNSIDLELAAGEALAGLGPERFVDFFRAEPNDPTTILPSSRTASATAMQGLDVLATMAGELSAALPALRAARRANADAANSLFAPGQHSNNWAVDAGHSATGHALLANDQHLGMLNPPYWWLSHLDSTTFGDGTLSLAGMNFPALPGVIFGHNDAVGWTATAANYDTYDAYIEHLDPDKPDHIWHNGRSVKLKEIETQIGLTMDGTWPLVTRQILVSPIHGPILPDSCTTGYCIAASWTGMDAVGEEINAIFDLMSAHTVDEGLAAAYRYRFGPYNWVVADADGRIGYTAAAELPIRRNAAAHPPYLPMPGTGESDWDGEVPDEVLARVVDPAAGYLITANNDIYGTLTDNDPLNDPYYFYWYMDIGYRAGRIHDRLRAVGGGLTADDMARLQNDNVSELAKDLLPHLLAAAQVRPDAVDSSMDGALAYLADWDFSTRAAVSDFFRPELIDETTKRQSAAALLFHVWFGFVAESVFGDEFDAADLDLPGRETENGPQFEARALRWLLEQPAFSAFGAENWWDDQGTAVRVETKEDVLLGALRQSLDWLSQTLGASMADWQWGDVHTAEYGLSFSGFTLPDFLAPILGPVPADGGDFTVNVGNRLSLTEDLQQAHSPAARIVMELDGERMPTTVVLPGGQSESPSSKHYADQFADFLAGRQVPLYFTLDEIIPVTETRLQFVPRQ
jgi:penicillin amidase